MILLIIADYLQNPYGKGANIAPNAVIKSDLMEQYYRLSSKMTCDWYRPAKNTLVAHLTLPSRTKRGIHYDIVFEFDITGIDEASVTTMPAVPCKVFSNCPSFSYTYANVFDGKKQLCRWLKDKYEKTIFKKDPVVRNPNEIIGYERSIFIAGLYIQRLGVQARLRPLLIRASNRNFHLIAKEIQEQNDLERRYAAAQPVEVPKSVPAPRTTTSTTSRPFYPTKSSNAVKKVATTKTIKSAAKPVGVIGRIKSIGKTKKIK